MQIRRSRAVKNNGTTFLTRRYAGSRYIKETLNGTDSEYTYLGGDAYSAPVVSVKSGGSTTYYYIIRDYLGSITHVYNASNGTTREYSYDAWGRRRNATDWSYDLTGQPELLADRGFTSHEHLPWFNLINMNGRLYDPLVGAFLTPDPVVQTSGKTQGLNRYTYCMNNPLLYVDYNGYTWFGNFFRWAGENWVQIADVVLTAALVTAECVTGQYYLVIPTLNAGMNVWSNAKNIKEHPGNFATFFGIGAGCGYLSVIGGGPLTAGLQTGLNDLVNQKTDNIFGDMVFATAFSTLSLALGSTLQSFGVDKVASKVLGNMAGSYLSSSYSVRENKFDWSLTPDKMVGMTVSGVTAGLRTNSNFATPENMCIPGNFLTNFTIPTLVNPMTPALFMPYMPSINLPNSFPGMPPSPLPLPQVTPLGGY